MKFLIPTRLFLVSILGYLANPVSASPDSDLEARDPSYTLDWYEGRDCNGNPSFKTSGGTVEGTGCVNFQPTVQRIKTTMTGGKLYFYYDFDCGLKIKNPQFWGPVGKNRDCLPLTTNGRRYNSWKYEPYE